MNVDNAGGPGVGKAHFSDVEDGFWFVAFDLIADQEPHWVLWRAGAAWQLALYSKSRALTLGRCTHSVRGQSN